MPGFPGCRASKSFFLRNWKISQEVQEVLSRLHLEVSAVNVNVKSDPEFVRGSLASPDPAIRRKAVGYLKSGKDAAAALGADRVTCCPLADGFDYAFQTHYGAAWQRLIDCVREVAGYRPEITLFMEYKPWETRVHGLLSSAAKTILLLQSAGGENVGVTIDTGHSTFGGEAPAESLMLVASSGLPFYIHTNDNNGRWDWDLVAGSCNIWEYLEFLYYLQELKYDGWLTSDVAPFRQDPVEIFALNVRVTDQLWRWLREIDRRAIHQHLLQHDFLSIRKLIDPHLFPLLSTPMVAK